jgi:hypothetical protein
MVFKLDPKGKTPEAQADGRRQIEKQLRAIQHPIARS